MSGFGSVIGSMLLFFVIIGTLLGVFFSYQTQIAGQAETLESFEQRSLLNGHYDFDFTSPYYSSGRMNFIIENTGKETFLYKRHNVTCFDFYSSSKFMGIDDKFMNLIHPLSVNYYSVGRDERAIASLISAYDSSIDNRFKALSCDGVEKEYLIKAGKNDWWDTNWKERKKIFVNNTASDSIAEYQIHLELNSSNFDFTLYDEEEFRFVLPIKENFVLDLTFDKYQQALADYSKYSNIATLGSGAAIDGADPIESQGLILGGLELDGTDYVTILSDSSLEMNKTLTYSAWIKWDASGDATQNIFTNGGVANILQIVNDGGVNDDKILFQLDIDGGFQSLYSTATIDDKWHLVVATYDGADMRIYIDGYLDSATNVFGEIDSISADNYIGYDGIGTFYSGEIDEVKILDIALNSAEVEDLYYNNLRFRELDYYVADFDTTTLFSDIYVKIPYIASNENITFDFYYGNDEVSSNSDMTTTFAYNGLRTIGYLVNERIESTTGIAISSLYDNNTVIVGNDVSPVLDEQDSDILLNTDVDADDFVKARYLAQVEGNGQGDDIIVPISWANTEFYYSGLRNAVDRFCMISPWGDANVDIAQDGGAALWSGVVSNTVTCVNTVAIGTNNVAGITSDIPILTMYYGDTSDDAFPFMPPTKKDVFGNPTGAYYLAMGPNGDNLNLYDTSGWTVSSTEAAYGQYTFNPPAAENDGASPAVRAVSSGSKAAIQIGDGDGAEATTHGPLQEMGTKFGAYTRSSYIVATSPYPDANCSTYNAGSAIPIDTVVNGVGTNGVYAYDFDTGGNDLYLNYNWKLECEKPVWTHYEDWTNEDETQLIGHLQMRQYIYPEPTVMIS